MKHVAAYLLAQLGGKSEPSAKDVTAILSSVGIEAESEKLDALLGNLKGRDIMEVIAAGRTKMAAMPSGGGAAPVAAAAAPSGGGAAAVKAKEPEPEPEEEEASGFVRACSAAPASRHACRPPSRPRCARLAARLADAACTLRGAPRPCEARRDVAAAAEADASPALNHSRRSRDTTRPTFPARRTSSIKRMRCAAGVASQADRRGWCGGGSWTGRTRVAAHLVGGPAGLSPRVVVGVSLGVSLAGRQSARS
jgi:large subunit ribosomal protein LP2